MITNKCKTIRQELEEADAGHEPGDNLAVHLRGCSDCRAFASEQSALLGLIGTLEPVVAPSDFDFRLRARLARERSREQNGAGLRSFLRISRPVAAAALVLLVAVVGVVVKNRLTVTPSHTTVAPAATVMVPGATLGGVSIATTSDHEVGNTGGVGTTAGPKHTVAVIGSRDVAGQNNRGQRVDPALGRRGPGTVTREFGLTPASIVVSETDYSGPVVRVPLDPRALQISIDDGRGETRTISLPRVSFGSQRLVATQSFMPTVSTTKGVW
ncbi:MAG: hypothetical protein JWM21_3844 [Acidobacteria bacterium]|nr:hypothetical protein [Acidobacteriota bacterium]